MQIIKSLLTLPVFIVPFLLRAQTTYLPEGSKEYDIIDRLEIKDGTNHSLLFSGLKPYSRRFLVREAEFLDSARIAQSGPGGTGGPKGLNLTATDVYNLHCILMDNQEWVSAGKPTFPSKHPVLTSFYTTPPNLLEVNTQDFFLALNPIVSFQAGGESAGHETLFYNKRGITARGRIAGKIGFSTTITDNQERDPLFVQERVDSFHAVPGVGFFKAFKTTGYDYFDARGYITFNITKYIDVQYGYDKNFIGDGYRSLFLSDFSNAYLFLKLNTKIWKFNYQNLFMELMPQFIKHGDVLLARKYAAMHHLSMDVTRWLNLGVFESIIFGRKDIFDLEYLNPIIFLRHIEGTVGSPDNAFAGADFKANVAHHVQFYGQLLLDEFILKQVFKKDGYWANKYGYQLGVKYVDAFTVPNLDLQFETNRVRPFTYSHNDSVADYTHYDLPLAHPLGANFQEFIGIVKYQPAAKWYLSGRLIYYYQGLDSAGQDFGSNPFEPYTARGMDFGYQVGSGRRINVVNGALTLSYEWKENLFLEGTYLFRKQTGVTPTNMFEAGVRWNAARRDFDF